MGLQDNIRLLLAITLLGHLAHIGHCAVVFGFSRCPTVTSMSGFVKASYLGKWYEYERMDNWYERDLDCVFAQYTDNNDGSIEVVNGGQKKPAGAAETAEGRATVPDASKPGELKVSFSSFDFSRGANYFVLDTDYTGYALVVSCTNVPLLPITIQSAWILTRLRGVAPANEASLKSTLESYGFAVNKMKKVNQDGCSN